MKKLFTFFLAFAILAAPVLAAPLNQGNPFNTGGNANVFTSKPNVPAIATATFAINSGAANNFRIVLVHASCPCTISNPTAAADGKKITLEIVQSATGSDTIGTWGTNYDFGTAGAPTLTATASKIDYLGFQYSTQNSKWNYLGTSQGM